MGKHNQIITPYQITWDGIKTRHESALTEFYTFFPQANEAILIDKHNAADYLIFTHK